MNTTTMMPIPVFMPNIHSVVEVARCPECQHIEDKKTVCKNCGHEYREQEEDSSELKNVLIFISIAIVVIWVMATVIRWIMPPIGNPNKTLVDTIGSQWQFIKDLCHRIY